MMKWLSVLIIFVLLASCQRAKDKGRDLLDASLAKAKKTGDNVLQSGVKAVMRGLTATQNSTFQDCFGKRDSLHVQEINGLRADIPPGFYQYFLTYKADKKVILNFIETLQTPHPAFSDKKCIRTDTTELNKRLAFFEKEFPDVSKQLNFFYKVRQCNVLECYRCNRYPFMHFIAFDKATGTIYHFLKSIGTDRRGSLQIDTLSRQRTVICT